MGKNRKTDSEKLQICLFIYGSWDLLGAQEIETGNGSGAGQPNAAANPAARHLRLRPKQEKKRDLPPQEAKAITEPHKQLRRTPSGPTPLFSLFFISFSYNYLFMYVILFRDGVFARAETDTDFTHQFRKLSRESRKKI